MLHIALDNGFEGPEAFARAFKRNFGQSPSDFRCEAQWQKWHAVYATSNEVREEHMKKQWQLDDVKIVMFQDTASGLDYTPWGSDAHRRFHPQIH